MPFGITIPLFIPVSLKLLSYVFSSNWRPGLYAAPLGMRCPWKLVDLAPSITWAFHWMLPPLICCRRWIFPPKCGILAYWHIQTLTLQIVGFLLMTWTSLFQSWSSPCVRLHSYRQWENIFTYTLPTPSKLYRSVDCRSGNMGIACRCRSIHFFSWSADLKVLPLSYLNCPWYWSSMFSTSTTDLDLPYMLQSFLLYYHLMPWTFVEAVLAPPHGTSNLLQDVGCMIFSPTMSGLFVLILL